MFSKKIATDIKAISFKFSQPSRNILRRGCDTLILVLSQ